MRPPSSSPSEAWSATAITSPSGSATKKCRRRGATSRPRAGPPSASPATAAAAAGRSTSGSAGVPSRETVPCAGHVDQRRRRRSARVSSAWQALSPTISEPAARAGSARESRDRVLDPPSVRSASPTSFEIARTSSAGTPASAAARRTPKPSIASTAGHAPVAAHGRARPDRAGSARPEAPCRAAATSRRRRARGRRRGSAGGRSQ